MTTAGASTIDRTRALRLVHHHPGRIRMRAETFLEAADNASRVIDALVAIPGVRGAQHNARTGSILVEYTPGLVDPDSILTTAADVARLDGIIDEMLTGPPPFDAAGAVVGGVRGLDRVIRELTNDRADLPMIVPTALAGAAVYSFVKDMNGPRVPRWDNLAWWAYSVFLQWHRQKIENADPLVREGDVA
jgi:hypothetical protein